MIILWILAAWFAISFGLLGAWILLCTGVRYYENVKNYKHVCYIQRCKELRDLYRKDNDETPRFVEWDIDKNVPAEPCEECVRQLPRHSDGSRCFGNYCRRDLVEPSGCPGRTMPR